MICYATGAAGGVGQLININGQQLLIKPNTTLAQPQSLTQGSPILIRTVNGQQQIIQQPQQIAPNTAQVIFLFFLLTGVCELLLDSQSFYGRWHVKVNIFHLSKNLLIVRCEWI